MKYVFYAGPGGYLWITRSEEGKFLLPAVEAECLHEAIIACEKKYKVAIPEVELVTFEEDVVAVYCKVHGRRLLFTAYEDGVDTP